MQKFGIASIINFCTNEARFLAACIEQAQIFSDQILIPVCDHFFDGTPENRPLLEKIYRSFPAATFIEIPYLPGKSSAFLASISRRVGVRYLSEDSERVFFIDADEIPDGKKILECLSSGEWCQYSVLKLASYWYFREPCYRANQWEDSILFTQKRTLESSLLLHERERDAIYEFLPGPKKRLVTGFDQTPLCHHFSWVRTKEEMLKKVQSWGHRKDRNWVELVEKEFSGGFQGVDFVHGYTYSEVPPPFDLSLEPAVFEGTSTPNVIRLSYRELCRLVGIKGFFWSLKNWVQKRVARARKSPF